MLVQGSLGVTGLRRRVTSGLGGTPREEHTRVRSHLPKIWLGR